MKTFDVDKVDFPNASSLAIAVAQLRASVNNQSGVIEVEVEMIC